MTKHTTITAETHRPSLFAINDTPEFREAWLSNATIADIAEQFGVSRACISAAAKRIGLPGKRAFSPRPGLWTPEEDQTLIDMRADGKVAREIGAALGRSVSSINIRALRINANRRPEPAPVKRAEPAPDTSLAGQLRASTYADRARIAAEQGWTTVQTQQRYHRAMAGEAV